MAPIEFMEGAGSALLILRMPISDVPECLLRFDVPEGAPPRVDAGGRSVVLTARGKLFQADAIDWDGTAMQLQFEIRAIDKMQLIPEAPDA